jgi:hypothetical protein
MPCEEKQRLLAAYEDFAMKYASAVLELSQRKGKMTKAEYDALHQVAEAFRLDSTLSWDALESHIKTHGC